MDNQQKDNALKYRTKDTEPPVFIGAVGSIICFASIIVMIIGVVELTDRYSRNLSFVTLGSGAGMLITGLILVGVDRIIELLMDIRTINEIVFREEIRSAVLARDKKAD